MRASYTAPPDKGSREPGVYATPQHQPSNILWERDMSSQEAYLGHYVGCSRDRYKDVREWILVTPRVAHKVRCIRCARRTILRHGVILLSGVRCSSL